MGPDPEAQILTFTRSGPHPSQTTSRQTRRVDVGRTSADLHAEIDHIFDQHARVLDECETASLGDDEWQRAQEEFSAVCGKEIRPAMQTFVDHLRMRGGGGVVEEREGDQGVSVGSRITAWISLSGDIVGRPRTNHNPFLQLDLDITQRRVHVTEGNVTQRRGTSGRVGSWNPAEITNDSVTEALVSVLRKAAT